MGLSSERLEYLLKDFERGFVAYSRIKAVQAREGYFESCVAISDQHRQQDGFVHAGLIATMADHTAGYAAFTLAPLQNQILTIEFKINFLRPAYGQSLVCKARVLRGGNQIMVAESEVFDHTPQGERLVAKALVTLASVPKEKLNRPMPHQSP